VARRPFQYALLRVVPHVERGEAINAGVVVFARQHGKFLAARTLLDDARLRALAPGVDPAPIRERLRVLEQVAAGDPAAGPLAALEPSERFHWLAAPSSTVVQASPVHTGLCGDPQALLDRLFATLVEPTRDVALLRDVYGRGALLEDDLAPTWHEQFERWYAEAQAEPRVGEATAMVVSTAGRAGPSSRTVLLKGADDRGFVFFTNLRSRKGRELSAHPRAALLFPWLALERQVIVTGTTELVGAAESDAYFASRPRGSQLSAAASPQSEAVASRAWLERRRAELDAAGEVTRPEHWGGVRVVPDAVEFWQGRPDRLHDRLRFRRDGDAWVVERLAP
jgi:pyridoxamine 5'-phosphate oxidase